MSGRKEVLIKRLEQAMVDKVKLVGGKNTSATKKKKSKKKDAAKKNTGMGCFAEGAYWRILEPDKDSVKEPVNSSFIKPRAPTISEEDAPFVPVKYNFSKYIFSIPIFTAVVSRIKRWANGRVKRKRGGVKK